MNEELHRHLDDELPMEQLSAELRREAEAWSALVREVREMGPSRAPEGLHTRVMQAVREEADGRTRDRAPAWKRFFGWWVRPRPVRVPPLAGALAAAALVLLLLNPFGADEPDLRMPASEMAMVTAADEAEDQTIYVQFVLRAPEASSVALAGDFNGWRPTILLQDPAGDGTWTARVPLRPGVHEYMFVIDGSRWVTDPHAERYSEDGFGNRNAVLAIAASSPTGL